MRCREVKSRLSEYLDHELDVSDRAAVHAHVSECEDCGRRLESLREIANSLRLTPMPPSPSGLAAATLVALDREVEPPMTIVTRRHDRIRPHFFGSRFDVLLQLVLDYEFKLVSYGFGVTVTVLLFGVLLASIRPLVSLEPFIPSSERMIWVSAAEGQALGGPSVQAGHSLARVPDEGSIATSASDPSSAMR